ncbi:MAG: elongation factor P [Deltaproteobacteria bacterium]|nr:elongation factor P [Deltaproteobacteria bacterium]
MASTIETSDLKKGVKIIHNEQPFVVVDFQHVKPGKGNAFTRTKIKNLQTGAVLEVTYKSGEKIVAADVEDKTMTFLYADDQFHFMDAKTYDQVAISAELIADAKNYLLPDMTAAVVFWKGRPISVDIPNHVELKVSHCEPGVRGDTATNVTKPATLETGLEVNVPLFINVGDTLKVDTTTGQYIERTARG